MSILAILGVSVLLVFYLVTIYILNSMGSLVLAQSTTSRPTDIFEVVNILVGTFHWVHPISTDNEGYVRS